MKLNCLFAFLVSFVGYGCLAIAASGSYSDSQTAVLDAAYLQAGSSPLSVSVAVSITGITAEQVRTWMSKRNTVKPFWTDADAQLLRGASPADVSELVKKTRKSEGAIQSQVFSKGPAGKRGTPGASATRGAVKLKGASPKRKAPAKKPGRSPARGAIPKQKRSSNLRDLVRHSAICGSTSSSHYANQHSSRLFRTTLATVTALNCMASSLNLPPEILLAVVHHLEPHHVLQLQSSCRSLYGSLDDRTVWTAVLRNMCKAQSIFYPSYPVKEMSVNRLRRACLAPSRFARFLESQSSYSCDEPPVKPVASTAVDIGEPVFSETHFLVPGGRFLLVTYPCTIRLFDLGCPDTVVLPKPILVSCEEFTKATEDQEQDTAMTVQMLSEDRLRVVVGFRTRETMQVLAYNIVFGSGTPAFEHVANLRFEKSSFDWSKPYISLTSSKEVTLIRLSGGDLSVTIVWNIPGRWYAFSPREHGHGQRVVLNEEIVVEHYGYTDFAIWSCSAEVLRTFPVDTTLVRLPFDIADFSHTKEMPPLIPHISPDISELPLLSLGRCAYSIWPDSTHECAVSCELLFQGSAGYDRPLDQDFLDQEMSPGLGRRLRILPNISKGEAYQTSPLSIEVQEWFQLPPNLGGIQGLMAHRPQWMEAIGTLDNEYRFTGLGVRLCEREERHRKFRLLLYSARGAGDEMGGVPAKMVTILEQNTGLGARQICMASGRMFWTGTDDSDVRFWDGIRSTAYILDFLSPSCDV
ncbi:hypothetical protein NMY22_g9630 [Coprinellus aureogranulatus]|nr:hypothetical protein NMY22_g9630 [Coprinellus aureogranulatus]